MSPNGTKWLQIASNGSKWLNCYKNDPNSLPGHGLSPFVIFFVCFLDIVVDLFSGGSVIKGAFPVFFV